MAMTCNFFGRDVYCISNTDALHFGLFPMLKGLPMACVAKLRNGDGDEKDFIFVNQLFTLLPDRVQEASILHEIGHLDLGHLEQAVVNGQSQGLVRNDQNELDADMYAANKGYAPELLAILQLFQLHCSDDLLERRIVALEDYLK